MGDLVRVLLNFKAVLEELNKKELQELFDALASPNIPDFDFDEREED